MQRAHPLVLHLSIVSIYEKKSLPYLAETELFINITLYILTIKSGTFFFSSFSNNFSCGTRSNALDKSTKPAYT